MANPKAVTSQTDFSGGQLDPEAKRADKKISAGGARQSINTRILESRAISNRPGRNAIFLSTAHVDEILMSPGHEFYLIFGDTALQVRDKANGLLVFNSGGKPWTTLTAKSVVWAQYGLQVYITFPGMQPLVLNWDGLSTWSVGNFTENVTAGGQKQTIFYRISPKANALTPSAATGAITLATTAPYFVAGMVGTRIRYQGRQITITGVTNPNLANATVNEPLLGGQVITVANTAGFNAGDVAQGQTSGAQGQITTNGGGAPGNLTVTLLSADAIFQAGELVIGPNATSLASAVTSTAPPASVAWDEEVMNSFRGWPRSVFVDQNRLGFCDFPSVPQGIGWSAVTQFTNFYNATAFPTDGMFELAPNKSEVMYVKAGAESNEIVFCDNAIYYIPISVTNPLRPGSVAFNQISSAGVHQCEPRAVDEMIIYIEAGGIKVCGIVVLGAYNRLYKIQQLSTLQTDLFTNPIALAVPTATSALVAERYAYVLNSNGALVVGKYSLNKGDIEGNFGWVPWNGAGTTTWISARGGNVIATTMYPQNAPVVELITVGSYLDGAMLVNNPPTGMQQAFPAGTPIGNMTASGGLAAAFNGLRSQLAAASATFANPNGFVGMHFNVAQVVGQALVWPSTDAAFAFGGSSNITIELRAMNTAPVAFNDGTLLASVTIPNQFTGPVVLTPPYSMTTWQYAFINVQQIGATTVICSQLLMQTGPFWFQPNATVQLMDQVTRSMGDYLIDANGNIIPLGRGGENMQEPTLTAGYQWTMTLEPFIAPAQDGQDVGQRVKKRRLVRFAVYVQQSSGFALARLFSGPLRPNGPALGTIMNMRRFSAWNQDDNPLLPPPLREWTYFDRPVGWSYDPREAIIKDTPGPLIINEIASEVTV